MEYVTSISRDLHQRNQRWNRLRMGLSSVMLGVCWRTFTGPTTLRENETGLNTSVKETNCIAMQRPLSGASQYLCCGEKECGIIPCRIKLRGFKPLPCHYHMKKRILERGPGPQMITFLQKTVDAFQTLKILRRMFPRTICGRRHALVALLSPGFGRGA